MANTARPNEIGIRYRGSVSLELLRLILDDREVRVACQELLEASAYNPWVHLINFYDCVEVNSLNKAEKFEGVSTLCHAELEQIQVPPQSGTASRIA